MANIIAVNHSVRDMKYKKCTYVKSEDVESFVNECKNIGIIPNGGAFCFNGNEYPVGQYFYC